MGNQNNTGRKIETLQEDEEQHVIDLDAIVERWIWKNFKIKSSSRLKRDDLVLTIHWKDVLFVQGTPCFYKLSSSCLPRTLFRTNFENETTTEQFYTLQTQRSTSSMLKFRFTQTLQKSQNSTLLFHLPVSHTPSEQSIPFGEDFTKEYELPWNVNSQIRVPSFTRTIAELNVDEEEFQSHFSVPINISGRITATIATRQLPNTYVKKITTNIVPILLQANRRLDVFEVLDGNPPSISFIMYGQCTFRSAVHQNIRLHQESLVAQFNYLPSAPFE